MSLMLAVTAMFLATPTYAHAAARVYLMTGLFDVFSTGMYSLAEKLNRQGQVATVHSYVDHQALAIEAADLSKRWKGPIIIVGHSLGADAAVFMAEEMNKLGAPVALVVTFGPAINLKAPSNVHRVVNFHQTGSLWRGIVSPGAGFRGAISNVDLNQAAGVTHFNIEKIERLHSTAMAQIAMVSGLRLAGRSVRTR